MVEYRQLDGTYDALASPVRRQILERLRERELRVTEVAKPFDMSLAAVSKHIGQLERAGLIRRRVVGREHWLRLDPGPLNAAEAWIAETRNFWSGRLDVLASVLMDDAATGDR